MTAGQPNTVTAEGTTTHNPVVTLFESYGSGAQRIGRLVADALGHPYHEQAFSSEQIEAGSRSENFGPLSRALHAISGSFIGTEGGPAVAMTQRETYDLIRENTETVLGYAEEGGVIVGRNATFILRDRPRTLHVKLDAPRETRIARAVASGISEKVAAKRMRNEDQIRADMSVNTYHWDPRKLDHYDLVLNTGQLDEDTTAKIIVEALRVKSAG